jgi:hypothetical protein
METLEELSCRVEEMLQTDLKLPKPTEDHNRKAEMATKHLKSKYHDSMRAFQTRCWQAEELGLKRMSLLEMGELLIGKKYHKVKTWMGWDGRPEIWNSSDPPEHKFEYFQVNGRVVTERNRAYGQEPLILKRRFFGGPTLYLGRLPNLHEEVPYPALLKVEQFKDLKLFNCFSILGPKKAYRKLSKPVPEPIDPVLMGCIYNLGYDPQGLDDPNYVAYYPLAKW